MGAGVRSCLYTLAQHASWQGCRLLSPAGRGEARAAMCGAWRFLSASAEHPLPGCGLPPPFLHARTISLPSKACSGTRSRGLLPALGPLAFE